MWEQLLWLLVFNVIAYALAPKPEKPKPAGLEDFDAPTADASRPIPVIFGKVYMTGPNIVWYGDLGSVPVRTKSGK